MQQMKNKTFLGQKLIGRIRVNRMLDFIFAKAHQKQNAFITRKAQLKDLRLLAMSSPIYHHLFANFPEIAAFSLLIQDAK